MLKMALLLLILTLFAATSSTLKDLNEVQYKFTPCGAVGRSGPSLSQCTSWYAKQNSSIVSQSRIFSFSSGEIETYKGAQGFRVPKSGLYNVSVAGAAGGRGICSHQQGQGLLWKGTIMLKDTQDLMILVGQQGVQPCDALKDVPVCKSVPKNIKESNLCFKEWDAWLKGNPALSQTDVSTVYLFGGGGGGGGASMVRVRDRGTGVFHTLPSVVAGGGGGSAANMSTNFLTELNIPVPPGVPAEASLDDRYTLFVNAKSADRDIFLVNVHNFTGTRGYIARVVDIYSNRAGAGGGYLPAVSLQQDGAALNNSENFALGGYDCLHLSTDLSRRPLIESVHGGFGGGGGQCESGGSGGGYSGGSIFSNQLFGIPGNGGFYGKFSVGPNSVSELSVGWNGGLDGYVEIVPKECGCGYKCVVYDNLEMFDCVCPNEFDLAPNEIDCFQGFDYNVSEQGYWMYDKYTIKTMYFDTYIGVLSVYATVEIAELEASNSANEDIFCLLLLVDSSGDVRLYSNVVRTNTGVIDEFTPITDGSVGGQKYYFLENPFTVSAALLVSNHKCSIKGDVLQLNVSFSNMDQTLQTVSSTPNISGVVALVQTIEALPVNNTEAPIYQIDSGQARANATVLIASISASVLGLLLIVALMALVVVIAYKSQIRKKHVSKKHVSNMTLVKNIYTAMAKDGSLVSNKLYIRHTPSCSTLPLDRSLSFSMLDSIDVTVPDHNFSNFNMNRSATRSSIWEYSRRDLVYMKELGEGQFGKVLLMEANGIAGFEGQIPVAAKTLSSTDPVLVRKFTDEANLMKKLSHPNIVSILAVIFEDVDEDNAPLMILEFMPFGDLKTFLWKRRQVINNLSG